MDALKKVNYFLPLSYLLLIQVIGNVAYVVNKDDVLQVLDVRLPSSPKLEFQTSVEYVRFKCGSHFKASHLMISSPLSGCTVPYPPSLTTNNQWTLLISGDEGNCDIKTRFRNAANAGYSAIIVSTTNKYANVIPQTTQLDPEYLDSYLVNPWDFRILSRYAYPNSPDYRFFVISNPPLDRLAKATFRTLCKEERAKMFYERQYYYRSNITKAILYFLEILASLIIAGVVFVYAFVIMPVSFFLELVMQPWTLFGYVCMGSGYVYAFLKEITLVQWLWAAMTSLVIPIMSVCITNRELKHELVALREKEKSRKCDDCSDRERLRESFCNTVHNFFLEEFQCMICCDTLLDGVVTGCGHKFCDGCLKRWRFKKNDCPLCRKPFNNQDELHFCPFNDKIDNIFDLMSGNANKERQLKRKEFQNMQAPLERLYFENLNQFMQNIRNDRRAYVSPMERFQSTGVYLDSDDDSS